MSSNEKELYVNTNWRNMKLPKLITSQTDYHLQKVFTAYSSPFFSLGDEKNKINTNCFFLNPKESVSYYWF